MTRIVFGSDEANELAEKHRLLAENPNRYEKCGICGKRFIQRYNTERFWYEPFHCSGDCQGCADYEAESDVRSEQLAETALAGRESGMAFSAPW
jgi:hypothetical protein